MSRCQTPEPEPTYEVQVVPAVDIDDWELTQEDDASCDAAAQQYLYDLLLRAPWKSGNCRGDQHPPTTPSPLGPNGMTDQWIYRTKDRSILEGTWTRYTGDGEELLVLDAFYATWHHADPSRKNPNGTILWTSSKDGEDPIPLDFCPIDNALYERARAMVRSMPQIKECPDHPRSSNAALRMVLQLEDFKEEFWFSIEDDQNTCRRFLFISFCSPLPLDPSYFFLYELESPDKLRVCAAGSSNVNGVVIKFNYDDTRKPTAAEDLELGPEISLIHLAMLYWHDKLYRA